MGNDTKISWTHIPGYQGSTWNCWQGCTKVSAGCKNCYMFRDKERYGKDPSTVVRSAKPTFELPLHTIKKTAFFTCSWSDFLHKDADPWRRDAVKIIERCTRHLFLILTKRPERMQVFPYSWFKDWPANVWMGVTVENQEMADMRIPILQSYPSPVRFLSVEPMLEGVELTRHEIFWNGDIDWVLCGFESGPECRIPTNASFLADDLRVQCTDAGVPFFFKQMGGNQRFNGVWGGDLLNGVQYHAFPTPKQKNTFQDDYRRLTDFEFRNLHLNKWTKE